MAFEPEDAEAVRAKVEALVEVEGYPIDGRRIAIEFEVLFPDGQPEVGAATTVLDWMTEQGMLDRSTVFKGNQEQIGYEPRSHHD